MKRSWPVAPDEFFRIFKDEPLSLEAEFLEEHRSSQMRLYPHIDCSQCRDAKRLMARKSLHFEG